MSYLTLNGAILEQAVITLSRQGAWTADVQHLVDPSLAVGDSVSLVLGSQTFVGTVARVQFNQSPALDVRIVGGAGHLSDELPVAQFRSPTARNVIDIALQQAGETLALTSDTTGLALQLDFWERSSRTLGQELDALRAAIAADAWRVLADGTVWLGTEAWSAASVAAYEVLELNADQGLLHIASDDPTVLPGQTIEGIRVGMVIHRIDPDSSRTEVYADDGIDRLLGMFDALVQRGAPLDLFAFYEYTVISQSGSSLELRSLDARMPSLSAVPYYPGIPGVTHTVIAGARCLVGFAGGSEQAPYIAAWTSGTPTTMSLPVTSLLHLGAATGADFVALAALVDAQNAALAAAITSWVPVPTDGGAALKVILMALIATGWPHATAATRVRAT